MRSPIARFALLVILVLGGVVVAYQLGLVDWLREGTVHERVLALRGRWWTPLAVLGLFVLTGCLPLPATAVVLVAGAVYGALWGWLLGWIGCMLGAAGGYTVARLLGRDFVAGILGAARWAKLDDLMDQHGFWPMVRARWMMPLSVVSYGGGLSGMKSVPFLLSSIVGMTIPIGLYAYVGHLLISTPGSNPTRMLRNAGLIVLTMLALSLLAPALRWWRRRRGS